MLPYLYKLPSYLSNRSSPLTTARSRGDRRGWWANPQTADKETKAKGDWVSDSLQVTWLVTNEVYLIPAWDAVITI